MEGLASSGRERYPVVGCLTKANRVVEIKTQGGDLHFRDVLPRLCDVTMPMFVDINTKQNLCVVSGRCGKNNYPLICLFNI